jgi:hypothetical protein
MLFPAEPRVVRRLRSGRDEMASNTPLSIANLPILFAAVLINVCAPARSDACSLFVNPSYPTGRFAANQRIPANALVLSGDYLDAEGNPISTRLDAALSQLLGHTVHRFREPLTTPTIEIGTNCNSYSEGDCPWRHPVEEEDLTPPGAPEITRIRTVLYSNPHNGSGYSCAEVDWLDLHVHGIDDRAALDEMGALIFRGANVEELAAAERPVFTAAIGAAHDPEWNLKFNLGYNRERSGQQLSIDGPMCIAIALIDVAGNIGPRSTPVCLDTTDENDPTVTVTEGASHACAVHSNTVGTGGSMAGVSLLVSALWLNVLGRRRRRERSEA